MLVFTGFLYIQNIRYRRGVHMNEFVKFAFYGKIPDGLEMTAIYNAYVMYCKLFDIEEFTKFEFIQEFNEWKV